MRFLKFCTTEHGKYAKIVPDGSYTEFIEKYKIPHDLAIYITRLGFKPVYLQTEEEFLTTTNLFKKTFDEFNYENSQKVKEYQSGLTPKYIYQDFRKDIW